MKRILPMIIAATLLTVSNSNAAPAVSPTPGTSGYLTQDFVAVDLTNTTPVQFKGIEYGKNAMYSRCYLRMNERVKVTRANGNALALIYMTDARDNRLGGLACPGSVEFTLPRDAFAKLAKAAPEINQICIEHLNRTHRSVKDIGWDHFRMLMNDCAADPSSGLQTEAIQAF